MGRGLQNPSPGWMQKHRSIGQCAMTTTENVVQRHKTPGPEPSEQRFAVFVVLCAFAPELHSQLVPRGEENAIEFGPFGIDKLTASKWL